MILTFRVGTYDPIKKRSIRLYSDELSAMQGLEHQWATERDGRSFLQWMSYISMYIIEVDLDWPPKAIHYTHKERMAVNHWSTIKHIYQEQ